MTTIPDRESARARIAAVLFVAQSFFSASTIAAFTLSPIIAAQLSGSDGAAGLPSTLGIVGRAIFAYPMGYLMDRIGRRLALSTGYGTAVLGAVVSLWAVVNDNYVGFLLGALFMGMARSAGDMSRYVAAEIYPSALRARVIGVLVFAGTVGAIGGPQLVPLSVGWFERLGLPGMAGPFGVAMMALFLATFTVFLLLRPDPSLLAERVVRREAAENPASLQDSRQRSLWEIFAIPRVRLAILSMLTGYAVMSFLMVITPLHMDHHNHGTVAISNVIMAHTLGMFGLSWLTGWMIDRIGRIPMILAGGLVLICACLLAPLSLQVPVLSLALFLLGLGWNFCFVAGSSLLSDALGIHERGRALGAGETVVSLGTGLSSLSVGVLFQWGDYLLVSAVGLAFTLGLILATLQLVRQERQPTPMPVSGD